MLWWRPSSNTGEATKRLFRSSGQPGAQLMEVRASIYAKTDYPAPSRALMNVLPCEVVTIVARGYIGFEDDTKCHHWAVDSAIPQSLF